MSDYSVEAKVVPRVNDREFTQSVEDQISEITADIKADMSNGVGGKDGSNGIIGAIQDQTATLIPFLDPLTSLVSTAKSTVQGINWGKKFAEVGAGLIGQSISASKTQQLFKQTRPPEGFKGGMEGMRRRKERGALGAGADKLTEIATGVFEMVKSVGTIRSIMMLIVGTLSTVAGFISSLPVSLSTVLIAGITTLIAGLTFVFREEIMEFARKGWETIAKLLPKGPILPSQDEVLSAIEDLFSFGEDISTTVASTIEDIFNLEEGTITKYVSDIFNVGEDFVKDSVEGLFDFTQDPESFFINKVANPFIDGVNGLIDAVNGFIKTIPKGIRRSAGIKTIGRVGKIETDDNDVSNKARNRRTTNRFPGDTSGGTTNMDITIEARQKDLAQKIRDELKQEFYNANNRGRTGI